MKGIIAEFGPIEVKSTRSDPNGGSKAILRVWTSEGVARSETEIEIVQP